MPTNIEKKGLSNYCSPTLIIASENDCLFPARKVLYRAGKIRAEKNIKIEYGCRLDLPIVSGNHLRKVSGRAALQSADSTTDNKARLSGGRKNCKIMRNWYLLFSTYQILCFCCHIFYNGNKERGFYEYEYYIEILTVFA